VPRKKKLRRSNGLDQEKRKKQLEEGAPTSARVCKKGRGKRKEEKDQRTEEEEKRERY